MAVSDEDVRAVLSKIQALPSFPDFIYDQPGGFWGDTVEEQQAAREQAAARVDNRNMSALRDILDAVFGDRVLPQLARRSEE